MDKVAFQGIHRPCLGDNTLPRARKMCLSTVQAGPPADPCVGPGAFGDLNSPQLRLTSEEAPLAWGQERSAPHTTSWVLESDLLSKREC